jgi:D-alanyl-D-alanine carboxypeptidase/D-alanyl-D-alanine-endopeptidase (penicillin-binding protein 4)
MLRSIKAKFSGVALPVHLIERSIVLFLMTLFLVSGCTSAKRQILKSVDNSLNTGTPENYFTGFLLIDPQAGDTLYSQNAKKYFTPASNTKIFTLYASLKLLPEKVPSLKYIEQNDTVYVEGTGDPTLLHRYFHNTSATDFLKDKRNIALHLNNFQDAKLGPGWSWDDYHYYYQPERGGIPLYGNVLTLFNLPKRTIIPSYFTDSVVSLNYSANREAEKNLFYFSSKRKDTLEIPIRTDSVLTKKLLEESLGKKIRVVNEMPDGERKLIYGVSTDSVLTRMMHESDNFLAEQLLVLASSTLSDTLNSEKVRNYVLEELLNDLNQQPRWVDGSGLSRYNLFTPESMVQLLHKMYNEIPRERLFGFFPAGGVSGTLEEWYIGDPEPYIIAKTGSLGNNHSLSGYLITKSGKTLIFSFMNNHFRQPSSEIKKRMQRVFEEIRDTY